MFPFMLTYFICINGTITLSQISSISLPSGKWEFAKHIDDKLFLFPAGSSAIRPWGICTAEIRKLVRRYWCSWQSLSPHPSTSWFLVGSSCSGVTCSSGNPILPVVSWQSALSPSGSSIVLLTWWSSHLHSNERMVTFALFVRFIVFIRFRLWWWCSGRSAFSSHLPSPTNRSTTSFALSRLLLLWTFLPWTFPWFSTTLTWRRLPLPPLRWCHHDVVRNVMWSFLWLLQAILLVPTGGLNYLQRYFRTYEKQILSKQCILLLELADMNLRETDFIKTMHFSTWISRYLSGGLNYLQRYFWTYEKQILSKRCFLLLELADMNLRETDFI